MSSMAVIITLVLLWCALSVVIAVAIGRAVAIRDARDRSAAEDDLDAKVAMLYDRFN